MGATFLDLSPSWFRDSDSESFFLSQSYFSMGLLKNIRCPNFSEIEP